MIELKNYIKKIDYEYLYLITYLVSFSMVLFFRTSQYGMILTSASSKVSYAYLLYTVFTCIGVFINIVLSIVFNKNNKKMLMLNIVLILLACIPNIFNAYIISIPFLLFYLMLNNAQNINHIEFIKYDFWMRIVMFIVIVGMYFLHLYPQNTFVNVIGRGEGRNILRYSFGFIHPNDLALFVLSIMVSFVIAYTSKAVNLKGIISFIFLYLITFKITDSKTFELSGLILILGMIFYRFKNSKKIINNLVIPIITFSVFIGCIQLYAPYLGDKLFNFFNEIFSNRVVIGEQALRYYPINITGYPSTPLLDIHGSNIDDMYTAYMLRFGIIGFLILQGYIYYCGLLSKRINDYWSDFAMIIITLSIVTINSNLLFSPMIYIVAKYYRNGRNKKEK